MEYEFSRTECLLGKAALERLKNSHVMVFGIGGVGSHCIEALARSGVGRLIIVDPDLVSITNIHRQSIAFHSTIGRHKTHVMKERILDINPEAEVAVHQCFFLPENASSFPFEEYDYVVDAVDTVTAKVALAMRAKETDTPIISSMGAGNKLDATAFRVADIYETKVCPLAKVMRRELKKRGVERLKVVYSEEMPIRSNATGPEDESTVCAQENNSGISEICGGSQRYTGENNSGHIGGTDVRKDGNSDDAHPKLSERDEVRRSIPGSVAFVPSVAGLIIAGEVVKDLAYK